MMQLKSLHLKNIKNHEELKINFTSGITAIIGRNGIGKSTILESIGLVLFDYLPYKQKEFITHGKTWGEIELKFVIKRTQYTVIRRIGNNPYYRVIYNDDIFEGKEDVQELIYDKLGVTRDMPLEKLFSEILCIPQGMVSVHFKLPPRQREEIFNSILGVDIYRDCFDKLRPVEKLCREKLDINNNVVLNYEEDIKDYDQENDKLDEYTKELEDLSIDMMHVEKELSSKQIELDELDKISSMATEIEHLEDSIKDRKAVISEVESKIKDHEVDDDELLKLGNEVEELSSDKQEYDNVREELQNVSYEKSHLVEKVRDQEETITSFDKDMVDYDSLSKLAKKYDSIHKEELEAGANYAICQNEVNELIEQSEQTAGSKCPITGIECNRIDPQIIKDKIAEKKEMLSEYNDSLTDLQEKSSECYRAIQIKNRLDEKMERINVIESLLAKNKKHVNILSDKESLLTETLTKLQKRLENFDKKLDSYNEMKRKRQMYIHLNEQLTEFNNQLNPLLSRYDEISSECSNYDASKHSSMREDVTELRESLARLEEKSSQIAKDKAKQENLIEDLDERKEILKGYKDSYKKIEKTLDTIRKIREVFKNVGTKLVDRYLQNISYRADQIYRNFNLSNSNKGLVWENNYNIKVGNENFNQLSGAEKLCSAIAVRMSLLEYFSSTKILVLDEPTDALDDQSKESLAECIRNLGSFSQIFLVTHDKEFSYIAENVIDMETLN